MHFRIKSNLHGFLFTQLAHNCRYVVFLFAFLKWNDMTVDFFSVHDQLCNPFLYVVRIFYFDLVLGAAEGAVKCKVTEVFRDTRINAQDLVNSGCTPRIAWETLTERPCGGTGQPAVLCLTEEFCVGSGYHLGVDIRLGAVDLADVFDVSRAGLTGRFQKHGCHGQ